MDESKSLSFNTHEGIDDGFYHVRITAFNPWIMAALAFSVRWCSSLIWGWVGVGG